MDLDWACNRLTDSEKGIGADVPIFSLESSGAQSQPSRACCDHMFQKDEKIKALIVHPWFERFFYQCTHWINRWATLQFIMQRAETLPFWSIVACMTLFDVKQMLGHSNIKTTERFSPQSNERLKAAAQSAVDYFSSSSILKFGSNSKSDL